MTEFLEMGGYARYVWLAFGITFVVLTGMVVLTRRGLANTRAQLARRQASIRQRNMNESVNKTVTQEVQA